MIIERQLEQDFMTALSALSALNNAQIVGSRTIAPQGQTKEEHDQKACVVAVACGFRSNDAFSLSPITMNMSISILTRTELDPTSEKHDAIVEAIADLLSNWHKDGAAMSGALTNKKFLAGELRMDGGTARIFDATNATWQETISFSIRGSERFVPPVTKNRIWWTDMTFTDFDGNVFSSAEQVDVVLFDIGRTRDQILECDVCQSGMADAAFVAMPNLETVWLAPVVQSMSGNLFEFDPKLKEVYFAGKSEDDVRAMQDYPWGLTDTSIIRCEL